MPCLGYQFFPKFRFSQETHIPFSNAESSDASEKTRNSCAEEIISVYQTEPTSGQILLGMGSAVAAFTLTQGLLPTLGIRLFGQQIDRVTAKPLYRWRGPFLTTTPLLKAAYLCRVLHKAQETKVLPLESYQLKKSSKHKLENAIYFILGRIYRFLTTLPWNLKPT